MIGDAQHAAIAAADSGTATAPPLGMLTRKQFLRSALGASAGALSLVVLRGCGGGGGGGGGVDAPTAANCLQNGTRPVIATNHGHVLVVTKADVAQMTAKTFDMHGSADHTHTVTISVEQFGQLAANDAIMVTSTLTTSPTFGTHQHDVMIACV